MATSTRAAALAFVAVGVAITSLIVRTPSLDRALTIDESLWIERSDRFVEAVGDARFGDTVESGHPGVTAMWIAGIAQRTLPDDAGLRDRYARARLGIAVVTSGLIVLVWWLAGMVIGLGAAAIGGFLLALDPFLLAHNRVLHLDGLLALLMVASFLALLASLRRDDRRLLLLSGGLAGAALLTKQPAAYLLPGTLLVLWRDGRGIRAPALRWGAVAALVVFVFWPVLWVRPWHAAGQMLGGGGRALTETTSAGFFLGDTTGDPGPLFYPVALALRSSAVVLPAAIAVAIWAVRRRREEPARSAALLLAFALGFLVLMSLGPKKADRYGLPSLVAIDLAVASGIAVLLGMRRRLLVSMIAGLILLHAAPALSLHPYELAHFNIAAGGAGVAQRAMLIGWGEGLDEAAEDLSRLPGAAGMTVATTRVTQFEDFFVGRTVRIEDSAESRPDGISADLVLFYVSSVQSGRFAEIWERYRDREPLYRLSVNGIPYVRVYRTALAGT